MRCDWLVVLTLLVPARAQQMPEFMKLIEPPSNVKDMQPPVLMDEPPRSPDRGNYAALGKVPQSIREYYGLPQNDNNKGYLPGPKGLRDNSRYKDDDQSGYTMDGDNPLDKLDETLTKLDKWDEFRQFADESQAKYGEKVNPHWEKEAEKLSKWARKLKKQVAKDDAARQNIEKSEAFRPLTKSRGKPSLGMSAYWSGHEDDYSTQKPSNKGDGLPRLQPTRQDVLNLALREMAVNWSRRSYSGGDAKNIPLPASPYLVQYEAEKKAHEAKYAAEVAEENARNAPSNLRQGPEQGNMGGNMPEYGGVPEQISMRDVSAPMYPDYEQDYDMGGQGGEMPPPAPGMDPYMTSNNGGAGGAIPAEQLGRTNNMDGDDTEGFQNFLANAANNRNLNGRETAQLKEDLTELAAKHPAIRQGNQRPPQFQQRPQQNYMGGGRMPQFQQGYRGMPPQNNMGGGGMPQFQQGYRKPPQSNMGGDEMPGMQNYPGYQGIPPRQNMGGGRGPPFQQGFGGMPTQNNMGGGGMPGNPNQPGYGRMPLRQNKGGGRMPQLQQGMSPQQNSVGVGEKSKLPPKQSPADASQDETNARLTILKTAQKFGVKIPQYSYLEQLQQSSLIPNKKILRNSNKKNDLFGGLPKTDDFQSPIKWVPIYSAQTEDGLARVTDKDTGLNLQSVINNTVYVPVIDYSPARLGITEVPTTTTRPVLTTAVTKVNSHMSEMLRFLHPADLGQGDWLAFDVALNKVARSERCVEDGCQSRCFSLSCKTACGGDTCATGCVGVACKAFCNGPGCFAMCIGDKCVAQCKGQACDARCRGEECETGCNSFSCTKVTNGNMRQGGGTWEQHNQDYPDPGRSRNTMDGPGAMRPPNYENEY